MIEGLAYWHPDRGGMRYLREVAIMLAGYLAYFRVRRLTEGDVAIALQHAQ